MALSPNSNLSHTDEKQALSPTISVEIVGTLCHDFSFLLHQKVDKTEQKDGMHAKKMSSVPRIID